MTPAPEGTTGADAEAAAAARMQRINAVFGLLLILTQASSPTRAMRLVITAVPSIAPGHTAVAWHPSESGGYYRRAPDDAGRALARLTGPGRLDLREAASCWAFPLSAALGREPVFLVTTGPLDLSEEEIFLLSVLAQMCGTVVANHELSAEADRGPWPTGNATSPRPARPSSRRATPGSGPSLRPPWTRWSPSTSAARSPMSTAPSSRPSAAKRRT